MSQHESYRFCYHWLCSQPYSQDARIIVLNKSKGFEFNSGCGGVLCNLWLNLSCSSFVSAMRCFVIFVGPLLLETLGLPCGPRGLLPAWIIQTDVDFPLCPPSVLCPLSHQLISTMPVMAQSTICSAPALFEMGRPPHLDPCLPLLPVLLFIPSVYGLYLCHDTEWKRGFNSPSSFIVLIYQCRNQACGGGSTNLESSVLLLFICETLQ